MNRFELFKRGAWSVLVMGALAFALVGCEGDTGPQGAAGAAGAAGADGADGQDGQDTTSQQAQLESCATCHGGAGDEHQAVYDRYVDGSALELTIDSVASADNGDATFTVTATFTILENGLPYVDTIDLANLDQRRFYAVQHFAATQEYLNSCSMGVFVAANAANGQYAVQDVDCGYAPELSNAQVYGYIADGPLLEHAGGSGAELPAGSHVHLYEDVSNAAMPFGTADVTDPAAYVSAANPAGCEKCHGTPYLKHGYRAAEVAGIPDFAACKSCHYDNRNGNHRDWQHMVDAPLNWATGVALAPGEYDYTANVMNDTHMSHAMEFPYPQSAQNCNTCHEGKLATVLDDTQFTAETCVSCHPVTGTDAMPGELYAQGHRAPPLQYLWTRGADLTFHDITSNCQGCHGAGVSGSFTAYHTGYDVNITDATGVRYADQYSVSIDQITMAGNSLTVNFSSTDVNVAAELLVSLYGWDSKHFIIASHTRDGSDLCPSSRGDGCRMEWAAGDTSPLFAEDAASVPGNWMVTLDLAAYVPTTFLPDDIPTMIADGRIKKAEITVTPELAVGGVDVVLTAANETYDLIGGGIVADYFKGANATVSTAKCNVCHDALASSFHSESGRGGDGIEVCKNCHVTTSPGSHVEMASRSIDSYVHAIHSFQDFDVDDTFEAFDPVFAKRYDLHIHHVFPNFTIRNCEACHIAGTFNVPDQSQSMPGVQATSATVLTWYEIVGGLAVEDAAGRNIGSVPEFVTGPASRACGACHRSRFINRDLSGDLVAFNAHTASFGTLAENSADDTVLYDIIDTIMSLFE